jgi:hypothetical protein
MSHWNYRVIRYADGGYGLHEVYYGIEGAEKESWTVEPIRFISDEVEGREGIVSALRRALSDAESRPILQIDQTWAESVKEASEMGKALEGYMGERDG